MKMDDSKAHEAVEGVECFSTKTFTSDFPFQVSPKSLVEVIFKMSKAFAINPEPIACSMLTILSAAIGNSVRIQVKENWKEPPFISALIIGESGSTKSPMINTLLEPIHDLQAGILSEKLLLDDGKGFVSFSEYLVSDTTVEALAEVMAQYPRGFLLHQDEMAGFINSFNQYKGKGNDRQKYLELWNCQPWKKNRVNGPPKYIRNTGCSILGGIQPVVIPQIFKKDTLDDGLLSRFLFSNLVSYEYSKESISQEMMKEWESLVLYCYRIKLDIDYNGTINYRIIPFSEEAHEDFSQFHNRYKSLEHGHLKVFIPKLRTYAVRIAGILHIINKQEGPISVNTFRQSVQVVDYFLRQTQSLLKIYSSKDPVFTETKKALVACLKQITPQVKKGKLLLTVIRDNINKKLSPESQMDSQAIAYEIMQLGLRTKIVKGYSHLIWEPNKIEELFSEL